MLKKATTLQRGDTLIEVLFAITVLSMVIVMSLSLMNQGLSASIRSLQITLVRQQIDSQAETLRFLNSAYVSAYYSGYAPNIADATTSPAEEYYKILTDIKTTNVRSVTEFGGNKTECQTPSTIPGSFIVNTQTARYMKHAEAPFTVPDTSSQVVFTGTTLSSSQGLWIEAVRTVSSGGTSGYVDFHVRACWAAPGLDMPMNLGTIVRLYDPAG